MIAGITGHQTIGNDAAVEWVRAALHEQIVQHRISQGLTSLAAGADQLFAVVLASLGINYKVVIPCVGYAEAFADESSRRTFQNLLAASSDVRQLGFAKPSEEAFFAAGKWIVKNCEVLFAVWNGRPARGVGGTGDVVAFARANHRRCIHINADTRAMEEV